MIDQFEDLKVGQKVYYVTKSNKIDSAVVKTVRKRSAEIFSETYGSFVEDNPDEIYDSIEDAEFAKKCVDDGDRMMIESKPITVLFDAWMASNPTPQTVEMMAKVLKNKFGYDAKIPSLIRAQIDGIPVASMKIQDQLEWFVKQGEYYCKKHKFAIARIEPQHASWFSQSFLPYFENEWSDEEISDFYREAIISLRKKFDTASQRVKPMENITLDITVYEAGFLSLADNTYYYVMTDDERAAQHQYYLFADDDARFHADGIHFQFI